MKHIITVIIISLTSPLTFSQNSDNEPYAYFSKKYIQQYDKTSIIDIPEVSELVNILMALHKYAANEDNMCNVSTEYYKKVKDHFKPFMHHPIIDTIHKNINNITLLEINNIKVFSRESDDFYYNMKMNACAYYFDENGKIQHNGAIKNFSDGANYVARNLKLIEDFSKQAKFREFYKENLPYYQNLIKEYKRLSPIQQLQT